MNKKKSNSKKAVMIGCGFVGSASVFALMHVQEYLALPESAAPAAPPKAEAVPKQRPIRYHPFFSIVSRIWYSP